MRRSSYRDRDYTFGQAMLSLRTRIGLTQSGLAHALHVTRRAVGDWESGSSYPKPEHLTGLITLAVEQHALTRGKQEQEIRTLWESARQKIRLDEEWLAAVLASPPLDQTDALPVSSSSSTPTPDTRRTLPPLPAQATTFVGRDTELSDIARILANPGCRLLTLLGPGGSGKTRLALQVASDQSDLFADGVVFVPLVSVGYPKRIVYALGDAVGLSFSESSDPTAHLLDYMRGRHILIVFDNFEHLVEGAEFLSLLLDTAPRLTLLVTSQVRLNVQAEWSFDVQGLAYPPPNRSDGDGKNPVDLTRYAAVQLFIQRARQVQPNLRLSDGGLRTVASICQQVAGIPLSIELAAAGARILPIGEIERQIRSNLDLLTTTRRDVPARQRSLRAVFDHSWNVLSESEKMTLSRLAVFQGGCTIGAAAEIVGATLNDLTALVDKSLLRPDNGETRTFNLAMEPRFAMLGPIREYAMEQLVVRGEAEELKRTHALYFFRFSEAATVQYHSQTSDAKMDQLDIEHDNMSAALNWTREDGNLTLGLELAGSLRTYWRRRGMIDEGRMWLEELLAFKARNPDDDYLRARLHALNGAAWLASYQHNFSHAAQLFEESIQLRHTLGETEGETYVLDNAARQARALGEFRRATALLEDALAIHRALGDRGTHSSGGIGFSLCELGLVYREQGDFAGATALFQECARLHRELGDEEGYGVALLALGDVARDLGDVAGIQKYCEESLAILRRLGVQWAIGFVLNNLALGAYMQNELETAFTLISESASGFRAQKADASLGEVLVTMGHVLRAQGDRVGSYTALHEALEIAARVGPRLVIASALEGVAALLVQPTRTPLQIEILAAAEALRTRMGTPIRPSEKPEVEQLIATARDTLDADAFAHHWANGTTQPWETILRSLPNTFDFDSDLLPVSPNRS